MNPGPGLREQAGPDDLAALLARALAGGARFAGLAAHGRVDGSTLLEVMLSRRSGVDVVEAVVPPGATTYAALTAVTPAAFWYERAVHDLFGLVPQGHPGLEPLVFPVAGKGAGRPCPGRPDGPDRVGTDTSALPGHVHGEGVFTVPYGPVRSGVFEAVEYLVETFGEDIPQLRVRPYVKHRGLARRFLGLSPDDGVLLAERVEGTMSVAHACAFSQAVETLAGVAAPVRAQLLRVLHAELERVANHLDSMVRHCEGAGQAVAYARLSWHKERVMRLRAALCGHRFGRGVVVPGGTCGPPHIDARQTLSALAGIEEDLDRDLRTLMTTPSFLDRLRNTGRLAPETARAHGALGPVGRASGTGPDVRVERPYGAYRHLGTPEAEGPSTGDALARQWVRIKEISGAWHLARQALDAMSEEGDGPWRMPVPTVDGQAVSWVESAQGELLYLVEMAQGLLNRVTVRTASFHNFALFSQSFSGDILTDFVFIEASFGVNLAGVAG